MLVGDTRYSDHSRGAGKHIEIGNRIGPMR
jgi:hypothetical protein